MNLLSESIIKSLLIGRLYIDSNDNFSEKTSFSCQLNNNKKRKIPATISMSRQAAGEIPDMVIFYERFEFGVAEVSKRETDNTKEKNDASLKLVKIMKSMLLNLVESAPSERHNLKIVGMFFSGKNKTLTLVGIVCFNSKIYYF